MGDTISSVVARLLKSEYAYSKTDIVDLLVKSMGFSPQEVEDELKHSDLRDYGDIPFGESENHPFVENEAYLAFEEKMAKKGVRSEQQIAMDSGAELRVMELKEALELRKSLSESGKPANLTSRLKKE